LGHRNTQEYLLLGVNGRDRALLPGAKAAAFAILNSLSKTVGSDDFLSVAGLSESITILGEFAAIAARVEAVATGPVF
jgi:hypothetical protein